MTLLKLLICAGLLSCQVFGIDWLKSELKDEWEEWKTLWRKEYDTVEKEIAHFAIWMNNIRIINQHNIETYNKKHSYYLGLNEYSDLSITQVKKTMNGYLGIEARNTTAQPPLFQKRPYPQLPSEVDWRKKGYVTEVKNQGQCGSCWSFSTTGSLEGQHFKATGNLVDLSEQNLVDCSTSYGNHGCEGGLMDYAFQYIKDNGGIDTESSYPYEAEDESCRFKQRSVGATDKGYTDITSGDEAALQEAVATVGPISVAIDAGHASFQLYNGGIYNENQCSTTQLDHGVLVVGYGSEDGGDYWIVKNSWGPSWGEEGYIRMARNKNNMCGIATSASYPNV